MDKHKPVIGLIGGIGSGKSLVASEFARHGGRVISGDELGHKALQQPEIARQVLEIWGSRVLDESGSVDRRKLGAIVFADTAELRKLEQLVFPLIEQGIAGEIDSASEQPGCRFVVLDAAVMLEAGWDRFCDRIVYVDAPREIRLQRLAEQRGWNSEQLAAREKAQMDLNEKRNRVDAVLDNIGTALETGRQVEQLLNGWNVAH